MRLVGHTFGAEHELADIPRLKELPKGFKWDDRDITIVNSNGIANDPKGKLYAFGGEINTPPTETIVGQMTCLSGIKLWAPEAKVNYRSNLHCHIRVPGLKDDFEGLIRFARYNRFWLWRMLDLVEPIPVPKYSDYIVEQEYHGAMRRYRRRKRSHHTLLTPERATNQIEEASSPQEFFELEVPKDSKGRPMWHAQPRCAVNLRQMRETDTIEFRHFPGTLDERELGHSLLWCEIYTECALSDWSFPEECNPWDVFRSRGSKRPEWHKFPVFEPYQHALEIRYRATLHDGTWTKKQIAHNINEIEEGRFNDFEWGARMKW